MNEERKKIPITEMVGEKNEDRNTCDMFENKRNRLAEIENRLERGLGERRISKLFGLYSLNNLVFEQSSNVSSAIFTIICQGVKDRLKGRTEAERTTT